MPSPVHPDEKILHVPIPERLYKDFRTEAIEADLLIKEAAAEALSMWTGSKRYSRRRQKGELADQ